MNILAVTPYLPYPPNTGGRVAQFSMLSTYPDSYRIRLIYRAQTKEDIHNARALERQLENLTVILCDEPEEVVEQIGPSPKKGLTSRLLHFPARVAWKLLLQYEALINRADSNSRPSDSAIMPQPEQARLPFPAYSEISRSVLSAIQRNLEWADLVQADFADLLTLSCLSSCTKPKVFVAHQVHTSYVDTFFQSNPLSQEDRLLREYHSKLTELVETACMQRYDGIIVFSREDRDELRRIGVARPILISPYTFPLDIDPVEPNSLSNEDWKRELVFIGSGEHGPNEKGLEWFLKEVYPKLDERESLYRKSPLVVIGSWSLEQQQKYQSENVSFVGFVDNLSDAIRGRVCICPIHIGAGLRTKLLAAAMCSSPIVTTTLGCQGIGMEHEVHCLIGDSASEFAAQLSRLINNIEDMAPSLATNSYQLVKNHFSQEALSKERIAFYESLIGKNNPS